MGNVTNMHHRTHRIALGAVLLFTFGVIGFFGTGIYRKAPPIPDAVVTDVGQTLFTGDQILNGQQVWQSLGGQRVGSVWGHGAHQAPDWSADWVHREAEALLAAFSAARFGLESDELDAVQRAGIEEDVRQEMWRNTHDSGLGNVTVFLAGVGALIYFVAGLKFGWSFSKRRLDERQALDDGRRTAPAA
jgi:nitric oxide reductase subunit B